MDKQIRDIKVSVIVTTYNQAKTIGRTLDSILAQKCDFTYEIIIGEDCSTDSTLSVCRTYAEKYPDIIRLIENVTNKGLRDNYYDCILRCAGDYIADCAGDDYWIDPLKLQKQHDILEANPKVTLVHTDWEFYDVSTGKTSPSDPKGEKTQFRKPIVHGSDLLLPIISHEASPIVHLCSAMYRKSAIIQAYGADQYPFRHPGFPCEDIQLIAALASMGDIAYIPDVTLLYTVGECSVSNTPDSGKTFDFYYGSLELTCYLAEKYGLNLSLLNRHAVKTLQFIMAQAFNNTDRERRRRFIEMPYRRRFPTGIKTRLMLILSSIRPLWRLCAYLNTQLHHG